MIVEVTLTDRLIAAYVRGYIERYTELHGHAPYQDDIDEITSEAIGIYA